eukprot:CAMPEP_0177772056 /NCGR_PEP_ID=MMETSP0491_2-20121128/11991_1 /TAXON_ID=63592 /ORGANISM="Tetraselmis chuii, Strain PLY429" /LENGTH=195 /DNA_ID=CAMNT_0019289785 /DNA_START=79 /DNA_END=666 /DNA_ORIENTATION=+
MTAVNLASSRVFVGVSHAAPARRRTAALPPLASTGPRCAGERSARAPQPALRQSLSLVTLSPRRTLLCGPVRASGGEEHKPGFKKNTEFGYSRKDVILIGLGFLALGYGMYYGLQATGMEPGIAGNWVQLVVILGMMIGWVSTYLFRVANKEMTYVKQLEDYETAVMQKRMEEMPEADLEKMLEELESDKSAGKK